MAVDALARALAAGKVPVTAYEMAVKAGYTGTEEQFAQDMGNSGTNAANAAASASAAAASAESVSASAAQIATNTSDISDLKTHLNHVMGDTELTFTLSNSEMVSGISGAVYPATSAYYASNKIDISAAKILFLYTAFHNNYGAAFYDENETYISGVSSKDEDYNDIAHHYILNVPENAKYFSFTVYVTPTSGITTDDVTLEIGFYNLQELTVDDIENTARINALENIVGVEAYLPFTTENQKMISGINGIERPANASYYASSKITLPEVATIELYSAFHNDYGAAFYDENETYISGVSSKDEDYNDIAHHYILNVPDNAKYFRFTVYVTPTSGITPEQAYIKTVIPHTSELQTEINETNERITAIKENPITQLPDYIKNTLSYKPLCSLSKGYICLTADDGTEGLATYTIPMLEDKGVPCTFGLLSTSAVLTNETYLATLQNAISNNGCAVAMHGSAQWTGFSEKELNDYFNTTEAFFATKNITEVQGAICPGGVNADTDKLVQCVAGGRYGVVCSGGLQGEIWYGDNYHCAGPRTNLYAISRCSAIRLDTQAKIEAIVDYAYDNKLILMPFWHDYTVITDNAYKATIEGLIDYAKTKGLEFITLGQIETII